MSSNVCCYYRRDPTGLYDSTSMKLIINSTVFLSCVYFDVELASVTVRRVHCHLSEKIIKVLAHTVFGHQAERQKAGFA